MARILSRGTTSSLL
jgi:hypothetical protein